MGDRIPRNAPGFPAQLSRAAQIGGVDLQFLYAFAVRSRRSFIHIFKKAEFSGGGIIEAGLVGAEGSQTDIEVGRIDHRGIMPRHSALSLIDPVLLFSIPLLDALQNGIRPVPGQDLPPVFLFIGIVEGETIVSVCPQMLSGQRRLCRADPGDFLQIAGPLDRHIISLCQRLAGFRVDDAFPAGLQADRIDPVQSGLTVRDIFSVNSEKNTSLRRGADIRLQNCHGRQICQVFRSGSRRFKSRLLRDSI